MSELPKIGSKHYVEIETSEVVHLSYNECYRREFKVPVLCEITGHDEMMVEYGTISDDYQLHGKTGQVFPFDLEPAGEDNQ